MLIVVLGLAGRAAPGRALLSCLCKKVSKEAHPAARVPALRSGQPAVLAPAGPAANSPGAAESNSASSGLRLQLCFFTLLERIRTKKF